MFRAQYLLLSFFYALFLSSNAHAAAWTQAEGHGQIITGINGYHTGSYYDGQGNRQPQEGFAKIEATAYGEYGLREGITLGGSVSAQDMAQRTAFGDITARGVGDTEVFIRKRLWHSKNAVFSVQPLIKLPAPNSHDTILAVGSEYPDAELRGLYGHSFAAWGKNHFVNMEAAFRHRLGEPADEFRLDSTLGLRSAEDWLWMAQLFTTFAINPQTNPALQFANSTDYDLIKLQLSGVKTFEEAYHLQAGWFKHLAGENTGAGGGILLSLWVDF